MLMVHGHSSSVGVYQSWVHIGHGCISVVGGVIVGHGHSSCMGGGLSCLWVFIIHGGGSLLSV